ncbi:MAG: BamA/TamA family outer membrane protein [bacterium]
MKHIYRGAFFIGLIVLTVHFAWADEVRYFGDKVVQADEAITGDVIVVTGDLIISGRIHGSAVAYVGDITLNSTAIVDGDVVAKRGRIHLVAGAVVHGDVVQGKIPKLKIGRDEPGIIDTKERKPLAPESPDKSEDHENWEFNVETDLKVAYSKVDGLYLGAAFERFPFSDYNLHFRTFGSGGYAFASNAWQGQTGLGFSIFPEGAVEMVVDVFHLSHTEDAWYMSDRENSLAAFFLHEDFRDYYLREGFSGGISWTPSEELLFKACYQAEQHESLENATEWALFGGDKTFLPNRSIVEGMLRELVFAAALDTRDDSEEPTKGWHIETQLEYTTPDWSSDYDYRRVILDVHRFQPINCYANLDARIRLGNSEGFLPPQKRFYLGGPSTLPGFGLKQFSGKESALCNLELRLHDDSSSEHSSWSEMGLFFFTDIGLAADQPLGDFNIRDWAHDVGVGICSQSGNFRLQVAKRTDTAHDPYTLMVRIERPF